MDRSHLLAAVIELFSVTREIPPLAAGREVMVCQLREASRFGVRNVVYPQRLFIVIHSKGNISFRRKSWLQLVIREAKVAILYALTELQLLHLIKTRI